MVFGELCSIGLEEVAAGPRDATTFSFKVF